MIGRLLAALALLVVAACARAGQGHAPGLGEIAGDWRGRWLGPAGHAVAALAVKPDGGYRMTMYLDGGDRESAGAVTALPSGRLRYQGADGNGWVSVEDGRLRFVPDGGGGGGVFQRME